jgi:hypothetical protein
LALRISVGISTLTAGCGIVIAEEAEEVGVRIDDVTGHAVLIANNVVEEEPLQGGDIPNAAAWIQAHRASHLNHGLEEVSARLHSVDFFIPQPG